jgi:nucleotide-binding universal stress UspA family protein
MVPRIIMVATDASDNAKKAEVFAAELAASMAGAELLLVHTVSPRELPPITITGTGVLPAYEAHTTETGAARVEGEAMLEAAKARVEAALAGADVTVATKLIENRSPAKGILDEALATGECKMIVVGDRGHGGIPGLLLGSVSSQVLHGAHCPVVIVKS